MQVPDNNCAAQQMRKVGNKTLILQRLSQLLNSIQMAEPTEVRLSVKVVVGRYTKLLNLSEPGLIYFKGLQIIISIIFPFFFFAFVFLPKLHFPFSISYPRGH